MNEGIDLIKKRYLQGFLKIFGVIQESSRLTSKLISAMIS